MNENYKVHILGYEHDVRTKLKILEYEGTEAEVTIPGTCISHKMRKVS
jgi:hypothetical protein